MKRKHAYLIIAHHNWEILSLLVSLLDHERSDIFLHIDSKVGNIDFLEEKLRSKLQFSNLFILRNRVRVVWGSFSQIKTELELFKAALVQGGYEYFHLLSGVDLPLQSQNKILNFFDKNKNKEFISFTDEPIGYEKRLRFITLFPVNVRERGLKPALKRIFNRGFYLIQKAVGYNRVKQKNMVIKKGTNWCSLTFEAVSYIVDSMEDNFKLYRYSLCADEVYKQTLLYGSDYFRARLSPKGSLRFIDWLRGDPYTFRSDDFELLFNSKIEIFARKFDENTDLNIIKMIYDKISSEN